MHIKNLLQHHDSLLLRWPCGLLAGHPFRALFSLLSRCQDADAICGSQDWVYLDVAFCGLVLNVVDIEAAGTPHREREVLASVCEDLAIGFGYIICFILFIIFSFLLFFYLFIYFHYFSFLFMIYFEFFQLRHLENTCDFRLKSLLHRLHRLSSKS